MNEIRLETKQICQVCKYMLEEHRKAMQPPIYRYLSFEDWIEELYEKEIE